MGIGKIIKRLLLAALVVVVVLNWTWGRLPAEPEPPSGSKYAEVDGKRIHYVERAGREPAVVMIHGMPGTWADMEEVAKALPGRRTITIDRPGYGFSTAGYTDYDGQIETLNGFVRELGLERPVIAGHSYGGTIAFGYALKYPGQTRSVVAVSPGVSGDDLSPFEIARGYSITALQWPVVNPVSRATFAQAVYTGSADMGAKEAFDPEPALDSYIERLKAITMKDDLKAYGHEVVDFGGATNRLDGQYGSIRRPVWIVQGEQDRLVSAQKVEATSEKIPRARFTMLQGGHMIPYTQPRAVAKSVAQAAAVR